MPEEEITNNFTSGNNDQDTENVNDASVQKLLEIEAVVKEMETSDVSSISQVTLRELLTALKELEKNVDQRVVINLEKILIRLTKSEREHNIDRLKEKANRARNEYMALGFFMITIIVAFSTVMFGMGSDTPIVPLTMFLLIGSMLVVSAGFWGQAIKEAEKQDYPEMHPVFTKDPWLSIFHLTYWRRIFKESKYVFTYSVLILISVALSILAMFLIIQWASYT